MSIRIVGTVDAIVNDAVDRDVMNQEQGLMSVKEDLSFLDNDALTVFSVLVKEIHVRIIFTTGESIVLFFVVVEVGVQNTWIPVRVTGPDDMRQILVFFIRVGTQLNVGQTIANVDGVDISRHIHHRW